MRRIALVLVVIALSASAGEVDDLKRDIAGLEFLNRLALSQEQAKAILPIAVDGAMLHRGFERERDWLHVQFHAALVRFKEEDLKDEGLSDEVMAKAGGLSHKLKTMGNEIAAAMAPLEQQAARHLDARQRSMVFPRTKSGHPLDLLRILKGSDYREVRDRLARQLAGERVRNGVIGRYEERAERLRITRLLHQTRKWDEGQYRAAREELLSSLVPGYERAKIAAAIRAIYRARYGRAGPLSDNVFRERMLPILAERAGVETPELPPLPRTGRTLPGNLDDLRHEVKELKADINLLNLMNGLHLDKKQVKAVRSGAKACGKVRIPVEPVDARKELKALKEIHAALRCGEPAPRSALAQLESPIVRRGHGYLHARRKEFLECRGQVVEELVDALQPGQLDVIRTYKACLVPPKDLRDPVRAGQAENNSAMERMADQLRRIPLDGKEQAAMDRMLKHLESHDGAFPAEERDCKIMLMMGVAYEAQMLDEGAYAARRAELAERLKPLRRLDSLKDRLHEIEGAERTIKSKIGAFLLDPRIVPLAEDRIVRLGQPRKIERPGTLPKADICEDGECGKP
jgi:hypothetical protein